MNTIKPSHTNPATEINHRTDPRWPGLVFCDVIPPPAAKPIEEPLPKVRRPRVVLGDHAGRRLGW